MLEKSSVHTGLSAAPGNGFHRGFVAMCRSASGVRASTTHDDQVFHTVIPRSVRLAEAPSFGKPILAYDPRSRGAESYIKLAKEILDHEQTRHVAKSIG